MFRKIRNRLFGVRALSFNNLNLEEFDQHRKFDDLHFAPNLNEDEWAWFCAARVKRALTAHPGSKLIMLGERALAKKVEAILKKAQLSIPGVNFYDSPENLLDIDKTASCVVVAATTNGRLIRLIWTAISSKCRAVDFIYKINTKSFYSSLHQFGEWTRKFDFLGSDFEDGIFDEIYSEAAKLFPLKAQVQDMQDLYQLLLRVQGVNGAICEFGSYQGHSGYIISKILESMSSEKQLLMFDTFDAFPEETLGIDRWWSGTHHVDFQQVQKIFSTRSNVELVKGRFDQTIFRIAEKPVALAFFDSDAYDSTKFLFETVEPLIPSGGIIAVEDYGHEWCLGARLATDEFLLANNQRFFSFFSQFSGLMILFKK